MSRRDKNNRPSSASRIAASSPAKQASAIYQEALALHRQGLLEQAHQLYSKVLENHPEHYNALHMLGLLAAQAGYYKAAVNFLGKAIAIKPDVAAFYINHGNTLRAVKQPGEAIISYNKAIALEPDSAAAYSGRGCAQMVLNRPDAAIDDFDKAIALDPELPGVHTNRGIALLALNRPEDALASHDRAIALNPDLAEAHTNRGNALLELNRPEDALASHDRAIALNPGYAEAYSNRGNTLRTLRRLDDAEKNHDKAIALNPNYIEAYWNKALVSLSRGDYLKGWQLYESRWANSRLQLRQRRFSQPLWTGKEPLAGKSILLHSEQGLGDTIQFSRYASLISALGARVLLEVEKPLVNLLRQLDGVDAVLMKGDDLPEFDFHCPIMSLPLAFRTELNTIPAPDSYLQAEPEKSAYWETMLGNRDRPRAGLVWNGSTANKDDLRRSIRLADMLKHLPDGFQYVSLQKEVRDTDLPALQSNREILHFGEDQHDFTDAAALCAHMDVIISVDTSVAHLSGAMGKPTWVLLSYCPDFRWLLDREDSPWYPTVRLYRQETIGDWESVLDRVGSDLSTLES